MNYKVMSFNLRFRTENDGINIFDNRQPRVLEVIKKEAPDLIGFQEAKDVQRAFLRSALADTYTVLGCGRAKDHRGEAPCIAYRTDKFELVRYDTFWLSDTPSVAGSRYEGTDQSVCPRYTAYALLSPNGTDECVAFFNTHLDHEGGIARVKGMKQTFDVIASVGGKFVLTGDMNDFPNSECIAVAMSADGVCEATESVKHTFHNYGRITKDYKIDYIFTNGRPISAHAVEDGPIDGIYVSDHYPICAEIDL